MDITFYYAPNSSAVPVASALDELGVPHRKVTFDLANQDQKHPDFLKLNPNGKVPTVVVDGTPMFEALAIMHWLGDRFGIDAGLWPATDSAERLTATAWTTWAYVSWGAVVHDLFLASSERAPTALRSPAWADHARSELHTMLRALDGHLAKSGWIVGREFGLADLIVSGMLGWGQLVGAPVADYTNARQWLGRCMGRPAIAKEFGVEAA